jgi:iron(III) transport system substrate-binding protein
MKTGAGIALAAAWVLMCLTGEGFSQESVESALAKLNALPATERHAGLVKGAQNEKLLEWYATLPLQLSSELIAAFRQRYPFIDVRYTRGGGGRMVNRVITEHRAGTHNFDVLGGTSTSHDTLMKAGLIARNMTPVRKDLREGFADAQGYRVMPFTYAFVIGYNSRAVPKDQRPRSYDDLLQPK